MRHRLKDKYNYSPLLNAIRLLKLRRKKQEVTQLAKKINLKSQNELEIELPPLPKDRLEWEYYCRPKIKGLPNRLRYLPMLKSIVQDQHPFRMGVIARQWFKTTMIGSDLAYDATTHYDYDQVYLNFKEPNLKTFSENKFRQDVFGTWPLSKYIKSASGRLGSMERVVTNTRSIIDMMLPGPEWQNIQGKSPMKMKVDEAQDHDWNGFQNARDAQSDTFGDIDIWGVGGFVDTEYYNIWKTTDQREWIFRRRENYMKYPDMSWRADLEYNSDGLIYDDYLSDVLDGEYNPQVPKNFSRHGYHLSQLQNPRIPLTMESAIADYKISPEFSIEWKEKKDPNFNLILFRRNILGEFVEGELKPITTKDMLALFDKTVSLTKAEDVDHDAGPVFVGTDIGGPGKTIVWIWQCLDQKAPIFKLLWAEKIETGDTDEQIEIVSNLIDAYEADHIGIDAGGGSSRTQAVQKRYASRSTRITYQVRPEKPMPTREELLKQQSELRYVIDRTFSIDRIIDLIKHPFKDGDFITNRIILPGADYEKLKWIIKQFVALEGEMANLKSTGQQYIKYVHQDSQPDDALQACNYAYIAYDLWDGGPQPTTFGQFEAPDPYDY